TCGGIIGFEIFFCIRPKIFFSSEIVVEKPSSTDVTALLNAWSRGDEEAGEELARLIYKELRRMAENYLRRERSNHTLQPTALVNEVWLRLSKGATWENRIHFFSVAARLMREVLVDYARSRNRRKRGGELKFVTLDEALGVEDAKNVDIVALDDALK